MPAVTKVEEWTRADTGVGAAIAAGSQEEKGIWALLVQADKIRIEMASALNGKDCSEKKVNLHDPKEANIPTVMSRPTSPKRFVIAVIIPALYDLGLW